MNAPVSLDSSVAGLLRELNHHHPLRVGGLMITVFGDIVMPRHGTISTQSLATIVRLFGFGDGVMRTALSRLSANGMFARTRIGRNSFYSLTEDARNEFEDAAQIIYAEHQARKWNGDWLVVLDIGLSGDKISDDTVLRKHLHHLGFAKVGPNVLIRPSTEDPHFRKRLDLLLDDQPALVIDGHGGPIPTGFKGAVENLWNVDELSHGYTNFIRRFEAIENALSRGAEMDDQDALVLRILAVHEYRHLVLKDPHLPLEILPARWAGDLAQTLCRDLYRHVFQASERWIDQNCQGEDGTLPANSAMMASRFGGLQR